MLTIERLNEIEKSVHAWDDGWSRVVLAAPEMLRLLAAARKGIEGEGKYRQELDDEYESAHNDKVGEIDLLRQHVKELMLARDNDPVPIKDYPNGGRAYETYGIYWPPYTHGRVVCTGCGETTAQCGCNCVTVGRVKDCTRCRTVTQPYAASVCNMFIDGQTGQCIKPAFHKGDHASKHDVAVSQKAHCSARGGLRGEQERGTCGCGFSSTTAQPDAAKEG